MLRAVEGGVESAWNGERMPSVSATTAARAPRRRASAGRSGPGGIRWDRLSRVALLALLGVILLMYVSPAKHWWESSRTAAATAEELRMLEAENAKLRERSQRLSNSDTLELEARRLGMTRSDERAFVIKDR